MPGLLLLNPNRRTPVTGIVWDSTADTIARLTTNIDIAYGVAWNKTSDGIARIGTVN